VHGRAEISAVDARALPLQPSGAISGRQWQDQTWAVQHFVLSRLSERRGCNAL
jgi:hypothetical protein